ncbi:MAG: SUMF1/EgtB/PvdO family nonheme iron enzyme [Planctomycetes bacterium]|nr:SUMF1/EgtB/PvdO family nonheme iron enzyme [Planctomycetota bacterium]
MTGHAGYDPRDLRLRFAPAAGGGSTVSWIEPGRAEPRSAHLPDDPELTRLVRDARAAGSSAGLDLGYQLQTYLDTHAPALAEAIEKRLDDSRPRIVLVGDGRAPALGLPWAVLGPLKEQPFLDGRAALAWELPGPARPDLALAVDEPLTIAFVVGDLEQIGGARPSVDTGDTVRDGLAVALRILAEWPGQVRVRVVGCGGAERWLRDAHATATLDVRWVPDHDDFLAQVERTARDSHVVHWIGHSDATADHPATALVCCDATGIDRKVPLADFAERACGGASRCRLLVLHSCWTDPLGAAALLQHVPHVLALQALARLPFVEPFHRALYDVLTRPRRGGIPAALAEMRRALPSDMAWLPALYTTDAGAAGFVDADAQNAHRYDAHLVARLDTLPDHFERLLRGGRVRSRVFVALDLLGGTADSPARDPLRATARRLAPREPAERDTLVKLIAGARDEPAWRRLLLRGDAGQGKTTLLKDAGCEFVRAGSTVIFASVTALLETGGLLVTTGDDLALAPGLSLTRARDAISSGRLLVLLDGLDEVPAKLRERIPAALQAAGDEALDGVVVVASRRTTFDKTPDGFAELRIAGLAPDDKRELVGKWFAELWHNPEDPVRFAALRKNWQSPAAATAAFVAALRAHPPLDQTTNDPLALTLAALWFAEKGGRLEAGFQRRDVLRQFADGLLAARHKPDAEKPFAGAEPHRARAGARALALWMLERGQGRRLDLGEDVDDLHEGADLGTALRQASHTDPALHAWCASFDPDPDDPAAGWRWSSPSAFVSLLRRTELFVPIDSSQRVWHFPLASLQDVLAAEALAIRAGLANAQGQCARGADGRASVAALLEQVTRDRARLPLLGEALALLEAWIEDETAKSDWLVGLHAADAQLGLRALGFAHRPPPTAVRAILERADAWAKSKFWDGFAGRIEDKTVALAILGVAADHLDSGVDRLLVEEEAIALLHAGAIDAPTASGIAARARLGARALPARGVFAAQPFTGEPLWRRLEPGSGHGPLWMMAVAVTVGMYRCFDASYRLQWRDEWYDAGSIAAFVSDEYRGRGRGSNKRPTMAHPATVTWYEAVAFTRWLNAVAAKSPELVCGAGEREAFAALVAAGWRFRLPWEGEWELACRAGTTTEWSCGDELTADYAWFGEGLEGAPHPVGLLGSNDFGLRDMHGNVWEWCLDAYEREMKPDGRRGGRGSGRVLRGGSYWNEADLCRSAFRVGFDPAVRFGDFNVNVGVGFRPVLAAPLPGSGSGIEDRWLGCAGERPRGYGEPRLAAGRGHLRPSAADRSVTHASLSGVAATCGQARQPWALATSDRIGGRPLPRVRPRVTWSQARPTNPAGRPGVVPGPVVGGRSGRHPRSDPAGDDRSGSEQEALSERGAQRSLQRGQ